MVNGLKWPPRLRLSALSYRDGVTNARVHLLYGLAGSGKSSVAQRLARDGGAVRCRLDEWMLGLYPGLDFASRAYGDTGEAVKGLIWSVVEQVLRAGADVVLDWNSWSVERRRWAVECASVVGANVVVHKLTTSVAVASERAHARAVAAEDQAHPDSRQAVAADNLARVPLDDRFAGHRAPSAATTTAPAAERDCEATSMRSSSVTP